MIGTTGLEGYRTTPSSSFYRRIFAFRERIFWYSFLMAFPAILLIQQNISVYLFPFVIVAAWNLIGFPFRYRHFSQLTVLGFGLSAIASVMNIPDELVNENIENALQVLPNYLYWCILVWFLISISPLLDVKQINKAIFFGLIVTILYYFFFQRTGIRAIPIFKGLTQNSFAFLLICFSPIAFYYSRERYGRFGSLFCALVFVLSGFLSGSRSSSLLVLAGVGLVFLIDRMTVVRAVVLLAVLTPVILVVLDLDFFRSFVMRLNPRTYELLYDRETTLRTDQSYLVRLAMVEKGLEIYREHPLTGIGLNNFSNYEVEIPGNFEGAYLVRNKTRLNETSSHNSYVALLAEGGILLLSSFVVLLLTIVTIFVVRSGKVPREQRPYFVGLILMAAHLYVITAIVNVFAWFLIGLCGAWIARISTR